MPDSPGQTTANALRNRFLTALLADEARADQVFLVRCDDRAAVAVLGDRAQLVVVNTEDGPPDASLSAFETRLRALIDAQPTGLLFLLVVGGGAEVGAMVASAARAAPDPDQLGAYHLSSEGRLLLCGGRKSGLIEAASAAIPATTPLGDEALRATIERTRARHTEAATFSAQLSGRFPLASAVLGTVCVLLYGAGAQDPAGPFGLALTEAGVTHPTPVAAGELWRLLSSVFLHANLQHLATNMLSLYFLGTFLERVVGPARYLVIYGASALGGSLASVLFSPHGVVGASGAIWGLMLAGFGLAIRPAGVLPVMMALRLRRALLLPLVINAAFSFLPGVGLHAHFGGGAVGLALSLSGLLYRSPPTDPVQGRPQLAPASRPMQVIAAAVGLALAASVLAALLVARRAMV